MNFLCWLTLLALSLFCYSCKSDRDTAHPLEYGFFLEDEAVSTEQVATKEDGSFDPKQAIAILDTLQPVTCITEADGHNTLSHIDLKNLNRKCDLDAATGFHHREYFALHASFEQAAPVAASAKSDFSFLLEIQLLQNNPSYRMTYLLNPIDLAEVDEVARPHGRCLVLFCRNAFAPELMFLHALKSAQASASFPIIFQGESAVVSDYTRTLSRRFVLRQYVKPEIVESLINSSTRMFEETAGPPNGQEDPRFSTFAFRGKTLQCTSAYGNHLHEEGVKFLFHTAGPQARFDPHWEDFKPLNVHSLDPTPTNSTK